ncbi:hypothetical protein PV379_02135 [Streptomyces caniscabiei]|uniref:hypothetical protein n=1 Tax=Streptomyces caniscabiei TaxID=2746961 RepID=UPI0029BCB55B|nr:hypothetical protein [Streptomyces caniscabiei]MDX2776152.1 hypothetical protein [Streptomyces caniscabiei]
MEENKAKAQLFLGIALVWVVLGAEAGQVAWRVLGHLFSERGALAALVGAALVAFTAVCMRAALVCVNEYTRLLR